MIFSGALNYRRISECKNVPLDKFCGLQIIDLSVPHDVRREILSSVNSGLGKRVVIPGRKNYKHRIC
jgi:hypothetical protein